MVPGVWIEQTTYRLQEGIGRTFSLSRVTRRDADLSLLSLA
jgi:hypothetical protein